MRTEAVSRDRIVALKLPLGVETVTLLKPELGGPVSGLGEGVGVLVGTRVGVGVKVGVGLGGIGVGVALMIMVGVTVRAEGVVVD